MEGRQEPKDQEQEIRAAGRREQALRLIEDSLPGAGDSSIFPSMELPGDLKSGLRLVEGARIGDFQLVRLAGRGGMGEVWEAEQLSLQRRVALKLLFADRANELGIEFFAREARAGGRLSHPGIVSVYGAGEDEGIHWIAMELIEGSFDLKASIEDLRSREEELGPDFHLNAAELVAGVADSLEVAHRAGIVHRDIKPGNILVTRQDEPVVTDFGLAKMLDEHSISRAGDIVGSHHYMSPELVAGKRAGIDHRSDAHTLGVRDLTTSMSAAIAGEKAGVGNDKIDIAELHAPFSTSEAVLTSALGLGDDTVINPSGGAQAAHTMMAAGLIRIGEAAQRISRGDADRAVATAASGPCLQQNLVAVLEGE